MSQTARPLAHYCVFLVIESSLSPCTSTCYPRVVGNLEDSESESPPQGSRPRAGSVPAPPSAAPAVAPAVPAVAALRQRTEAPMSRTVRSFEYDFDLEKNHSVNESFLLAKK